MKLTRRQQKEKECLDWFSKSLLKQWPPQEGEFEEYLAHSERGIPIKGFYRSLWAGTFNVYSEAKRWRGITVHELWEDSFFSKGGNSWWPGFDGLLKEEDGTPIPEHIMEYIAREIFRGTKRNDIREWYKRICITEPNQ